MGAPAGSRLEDLVSQAIRFPHPILLILCLKILANKQLSLDRRLYCLPIRVHVSISTRNRKKKKMVSCSISPLVHPGRSPGMMFLCLSAWLAKIYNTFSISTRSRTKKKKKLGSCAMTFLVHPGRSPCMMLLIKYAWALLAGYITRLAFRPVAEKDIVSCFISFLVHPDRSPDMIFISNAYWSKRFWNM